MLYSISEAISFSEECKKLVLGYQGLYPLCKTAFQMPMPKNKDHKGRLQTQKAPQMICKLFLFPVLDQDSQASKP